MDMANNLWTAPSAAASNEEPTASVEETNADRVNGQLAIINKECASIKEAIDVVLRDRTIPELREAATGIELAVRMLKADLENSAADHAATVDGLKTENGELRAELADTKAALLDMAHMLSQFAANMNAEVDTWAARPGTARAVRDRPSTTTTSTTVAGIAGPASHDGSGGQTRNDGSDRIARWAVFSVPATPSEETAETGSQNATVAPIPIPKRSF
ncbi:hypothetical protein N658DRAFT_488528 [Parathielavia hyrcaniae]|uniref:Uncharacterized protein n=1 Tax=Parathielavia hyrcaniae TaxID=113614 RepID=A0AAN6PUR4_9PEZI|nr:hypothetical protein N658DRAFT_488528 [Parathielavia hyrcaniae]